MKVLYWLESIRAPWLDAVMLAISQLGGEILFMAIVIDCFGAWVSARAII